MICENIIRIFLILSLFASGEACDILKPQKHGDWFCPPSTDPATCHLECHPGYVSTNATVITCQQHQWTEDPECITAVAIITAGDVYANTVEVYGEGIKKKLPNLPEDRYWHSLQLVNSVLILCGGDYDSTTSCLSLTASLQWTTHSITTSTRYYHSSVSMMGQLYLLGGYNSQSTTEHLTPPSQDWASGWDLLEDTYYACAAKIEPEVFIVTGGYYYPRSASVVAYNVTSGAATRLKDLNTRRYGHGCSLVMDSNMRGVLVAGGSNTNSASGILSDSEIYDVNTGEWSTTGKLTTGRTSVRLVVLGNKILAMGGYDGNYVDLSTVEKFNLTTRQWTPTEDMMEMRSSHAVTGVPSTAVGIPTN